MIKLMKRKSNNKFVVVEYRDGKWEYSQDFETKDEAITDIKRRKVNMNKREQNEVLRDLCGTSARAAREDMGL